MQIDALERELYIQKARNRALSEQFGINDLKDEVKQLKRNLEDVKSELHRSKYDNDELQKKYDELKLRTDMEMQKPSTADASTETQPMKGATFVEQMDWDRVNKRAEDYKTYYTSCARQFEALKEKHKEVVKQNSHLSTQLNGLQGKYKQTRDICDNRLVTLNQNSEEIAQLNAKIIDLAAKAESSHTDAYNQLQTEHNEVKVQLSQATAMCQQTADLLDDFKTKYTEAKQEYDSVKQQSTVASEELQLFKRKYEKAKELYFGTVDNYETVKAKYEAAKELLERRLNQIILLQKLLRKNRIPFIEYIEKRNENEPYNSNQ